MLLTLVHENRGHEVDFNLKRLYDMPNIEVSDALLMTVLFQQMIFFYVNFDKCRREIIKYEEKRSTPSVNKRHPKESKPEALDLLRCHSKNLTFEPVCLDPFNDARECMFKMEGQMRVCEPELNLFEECVHDPKAFAKFQALATPQQRNPKDYFTTVIRKNYFF